MMCRVWIGSEYNFSIESVGNVHGERVFHSHHRISRNLEDVRKNSSCSKRGTYVDNLSAFATTGQAKFPGIILIALLQPTK
jgi:hypothetical protein